MNPIDYSNLEFDEFIYDDTAKKRIDIFLKENNDSFSRSYLQNLIKDGYVFVNDEMITKPSFNLDKKCNVRVFLKEAEETEVLPVDLPLNIVYEDDDIIVINKEAGMVVHPSAGHYNDTLVNALLFHCKDNLSTINGIKRPGIVHRIDKDTSGLLVVAKNDNAHNYLKEQLQDHSMHRVYYAITKGIIETHKGKIQTLLGRDEKNRLKQAVVIKNGKEAITDFEVIEYINDKYTFVKCILETGRTHQIRVHMDFIKHPLINDPLYGYQNKIDIESGQLLHAAELVLRHPSTHELMTFKCDLPDKFNEILEYLRTK